MKIEWKFKTVPECINYLKINYQNSIYGIEEFYSKYNDSSDIFKIDKLLFECKILYKNNIEITYDDYCNNYRELSEKLEFSNVYRNLYSKINDIFIIDKDYYAAAKLIKAAEEQLSYARLSLLEASKIIDYNMNILWSTGYGPIYKIRTIKASNSILCYNNVFDYLLQIIFIGYGIYRKHNDYSECLKFLDILKLCDYSFLSKFYGQNKEVSGFKDLWKILSKAQSLNRNINKWANYIKHKGGINYTGVEADEPINIILKDKDGNEITDKDFNQIGLDLEFVLKELCEVNNGLFSIIQELVEFMDYKDLTLEKSNNHLIVPENVLIKRYYLIKKIITVFNIWTVIIINHYIILY